MQKILNILLFLTIFISNVIGEELLYHQKSTNNFTLQIGGTFEINLPAIPQITYIGQVNGYFLSPFGSLEFGNERWNKIDEKLENSVAFLQRQSTTTNNSNRLMVYIKCCPNVIEHEDDWIQFVIILSEISRDTSVISWGGSWQTIRGSGKYEFYNGFGKVVGNGFYTNNKNTITFTFPQNDTFPQFTNGLRLNGTLTDNRVVTYK